MKTVFNVILGLMCFGANLYLLHQHYGSYQL